MPLISLPNFVALFEYGFGAILQILAFSIFTYMIYKSKTKFQFRLSPPVFLYFCCNILQTFCGILHFSYMSFLWRPNTVTYNAYILYFTGTLTSLGFMTNSVCITFLSIDRIFLVIMPLKYCYNQRLYASILLLFF